MSLEGEIPFLAPLPGELQDQTNRSLRNYKGNRDIDKFNFEISGFSLFSSPTSIFYCALR